MTGLASVKSVASQVPAGAPGALVTEAIDAVTDVTYTGPSLPLSKFPLMVCGESPGYIGLSTPSPKRWTDDRAGERRRLDGVWTVERGRAGGAPEDAVGYSGLIAGRSSCVRRRCDSA